MTTIYVVTSGEYSSYGIEAIFDNKSLAELHLRTLDGDGEIEEYILDPDNPYLDKINNGLECYFVSLYSNGEVNRCYTVAMTDESNHFHFNGFSAYIFAKSKEHAIKIASDKRAQLLYEASIFTEES